MAFDTKTVEHRAKVKKKIIDSGIPGTYMRDTYDLVVAIWGSFSA